ncbi:hypothetical protein SDC9_159462 [bioreactor metagenome]|uniref:Uncharacterized protein n=1 Tax=bioreactor metagenome TaxID=1076179 RepID=A0A645FDV7_9ZZZZ
MGREEKDIRGEHELTNALVGHASEKLNLFGEVMPRRIAFQPGKIGAIARDQRGKLRVLSLEKAHGFGKNLWLFLLDHPARIENDRPVVGEPEFPSHPLSFRWIRPPFLRADVGITDLDLFGIAGAFHHPVLQVV